MEDLSSNETSEDDAPCRLDKDSSRARIGGGVLEFQLAGLVALRLRALRRRNPDLNLRFSLATNVDGANPFDDIVLYMRWIHEGRYRALTYFVQLKHKENTEVPVSRNELTGPISKRNKDFNLHHYFEKFNECVNKVVHVPEGKLTPNQKFLRESFSKDFRLVLFTTREVYPKDTRESSPLDFPFEKLFYTNKGEMFSFGESDDEIWNMMGQNHCDDFHKEFLPRLRIFSAQSQVFALETLLVEALDDALGGNVPRKDSLIASYSSYLQTWWESANGICISEKTSELEEHVRKDIHKDLKNLDFDIRRYNELLRRLENCDSSYTVIPGVQGTLRSALISRVLDQLKPGRYIILTGKSLKEYSDFAIESLILKLCDEIVISVKALNKRTRDIISKLFCRKQFCIRIVTSDWDPGIYNVLISQVKLWNAWTERWMLAYLTREEQNKLLTKKVKFQGQEMTLGALETSWPSLRRGIHGAALETLVTGKTLDLGDPIPPLNPNYIERSLEHNGYCQKIFSFDKKHLLLNKCSPIFELQCQDFECVKYREILWNLRVQHVRFLVTGFPKDILEKLRSFDSSWEECDSHWVPLCKTRRRSWPMAEQEIKIRWTTWSNLHPPRDTKLGKCMKLCWLTYEGGRIVYKLIGRDKPFLRLKLKKHRQCKEVGKCIHKDISKLSKWNGVSFLSSDPGIGKTTFLLRMSHALKDKFPLQWVLFVRISHGTIIEEIPENVKVKDIVNLLAHVAHPKETTHTATRCFIEDCLKNSGNISILLDGVDEVCPSHKRKVLRVLELLLQETRFERLWVAARPGIEEELGRTLHCHPLYLQPFSFEDQRQYLLRRWSKDCTGKTTRQLQVRVDRLLYAVRMATMRDGRTLCDIPLYMQMLAEAYREDNVFSNNVRRLSSFANISRLKIIRKFLEETRRAYWAKMDVPMDKIKNAGWDISSKDTFLRHHKTCATYLLFNTEHLGSFHRTVEKEMKQIVSVLEKEKTGIIVKVMNGKPVFIHRIFAEYFAALWLSENYRLLPKSAEYIYNGNLEEVRYFFEAILAEGHPLHEAAISNRVESLLAILFRSGQDVEEEDNGGRRALHLAAISGHEGAVRALLDKGANMKIQDKVLGWTPLRYICKLLCVPDREADWSDVGHTMRHMAVAELLLQTGAGIQDSSKFFKRKEVLSIAIRKNFPFVVEAFLASKKSSLLEESIRNEYVHEAVKHNSVKVLAVLFRSGFDVNEAVQEGITPLHKAASFLHIDICELLIQNGANVNQQDMNGNTPLHTVVGAGQEEHFKSIPDWKIKKLEVATTRTQLSICHLLLNNGGDVDSVNDWGLTPLHLVAASGHEDLCRLFLMRGASVNVETLKGITPLRLAMRNDHYNICRLLQMNGAEAGFLDVSERSSTFKKLAGEGTMALCRLLMDSGVDINSKDDSGVPGLHWAVRERNFRFCLALLDCGADVNARNKRGQTPLHWAARAFSDDMSLFLLENGAEVDARDEDGETVLHFAARMGRKDSCHMLLERGADVHCKDVNGATALHHAAACGHFLVCRLLLESGANIHAVDAHGNTALHKAVGEGRQSVVRLLLENGARTGVSNDAGESAFDVAKRVRRPNICKLLLESSEDTPSLVLEN